MSSSEKPPLVLTVDDEPAVNEILKEMLEIDDQYRVISAESGLEAIKLLYKHKEDVPSLILLDIMMEPMDGWQTLLKIKRIEHCSAVPAVMVTARALTPETLSQGQRKIRYIEDYLVKPIHYDRLMKTLGDVLDSQRKVAEMANYLVSKGWMKEAQKYEDYAKATFRHTHLLATLKECASSGTTETMKKVAEVIAMQRAIIKKCQDGIKRITSVL